MTFSPDKFTVTTTYSKPFADWKSLFSNMAPAHIMSKIGWNKGLLAANVNASTVISAGPFQFTSYTPGKDFIISRNPKYWGKPANLARIDYRFITDSSQVEPALANNEINASYPQPQLDLVSKLKSLPGVTLDERPGLQYEHLDFNEANAFLADVNLRKAIAMSIDRKDLIAKTVGQFATGIVPDNNHVYVPGQPQYRDNSSGVTSTVTSTASPGPYDTPDVAGAKQLLTSNGYTLTNSPCCGAGSTQTLMKNGKAVALRITSTQGNRLRNSEEAFIINALAQIGIKVTEADTTGLSKTLKAGDYDMIIFAWVDTPFASGNDGIFQTKGGQNYNRYSNKALDQLIAQADVALDPAQQANLYNEVDALVWKDMVTLPLFQKPTLLVYQSKYKNMHNNITSEGPVYNEEEWGLSR
jgi:peptide/nickel transport system substrate-binding protein